ncbi:MAG: hypothetical protein ACFFAS_00320 [Promethearchaeota archaeon]
MPARRVARGGKPRFQGRQVEKIVRAGSQARCGAGVPLETR